MKKRKKLKDSSLIDSVTAFMKDTKYSEALQLLKVIILQEESAKKIFPMFQKATCEIKSGRMFDTVNTCNEIARFLDSINFEDESKDFNTKCLEKLKYLVKKLIEVRKLDAALRLIRNQFELIKHSYAAEEKLEKLQNQGVQLKAIADNFYLPSISHKTEECYLLLDDILCDTQLVKNVDTQKKTKAIGWFMYYYGICCNFMQDFTKSLEIHSKVIFFIKSNLGDEATECKVYGRCHHNFANA